MAGLFAESAKLAWVEFIPSKSPGLAEQLTDLGFSVFDTEYLFGGTPEPAALEMFLPTHTGVTLSTGLQTWKGIPRQDWTDYQAQLTLAIGAFGLMQTDLLCLRSPLSEQVRERFSRRGSPDAVNTN
jgi:hypothetical protein